MKIIFIFTITLSLLFALFPLNTSAQEHAELNTPIPEGAKLRIGEGALERIVYFPDGTRFAVASSIGVRIYDSLTGKELNQLTDGKSRTTGFRRIRFSPDGKTITTEGLNGTVLLWDASTELLRASLADDKHSLYKTAFSPDGKVIATLGADEYLYPDATIQLWDAGTGKYLRTLIKPNYQFRSDFGDMAFLPDGKTIATWGYKELELWDVDTGEPLKTLKTLGESGIRNVCFSPDGKMIVMCGYSELELWDAVTGQHLKTLSGLSEPGEFHRNNKIKECRFSPDGRALVILDEAWSGSYGGRYVTSAYLWNVSTRSGEYLQSAKNFSDICFSPDGKILASIDVDASDGEMCLWNIGTGKILSRFFIGSDTIDSSDPNLCFSPNGKVIAMSGVDGTIHLWSPTTGQRLIKLSGHIGSVSAFSFSPEGITILSKGSDKTVRLWDAITGELLKTLSGYTNSVQVVSFSPDGKTIARGNSDKTVLLLDVGTGQLLKTLTGSTGYISSIFYSPDGKTIVCKSLDQVVYLWDVNTGHLLKTLRGIKGKNDEIAFSPDRKMIASIGADNTIQLWDTSTAELLKTFVMDKVYEVSFSLNDNILISCSNDAVQLWDTQTGQLVRTLSGISGGIESVHFSPDRDTIVTSLYYGGPGAGVFLYDGRTGALLKEFSDWSGLESCRSFSPDGNIIAMVSSVVKLFDISTRRHLSTLSGHVSYPYCGGGTITTVQFSPDGQTIATGSSDRTIRLSNVKTGEPLKTLIGHTHSVNSVAFSPDGKTLASGSSDGTILLWEVP